MKRSRDAFLSYPFLVEMKPCTRHRRYSTISAAATSSATVVDMDFCLRVAKRVLRVDPTAMHTSTKSYENLACSPLSIAAVLNILAAGSAGPTREQLLDALDCDSVEEVNDVASTLAEVLKGDDDDEDAPDIEFANGLWVDQTWRLKRTFRKVLRNVHESEARVVDFKNQVDQVVKDANLWAEEQTKGLVKQILSRQSIKKDTKMILANALYFKGVWVDTFKLEETKDDDFHLLNGSKVRAPFMRQWDTYFDYGTLEGCQVLRMLYREGEQTPSKSNKKKKENPRSFSMYIFLPDEKDGLPNLMENINMDRDLFNHQMKLNYVNIKTLFIPKFSFDCELNLSKPMKDLGLTLPFDRRSCDLTRMVDDTSISDGENPYVEKVLQKCRVEINEKGTKAAALTRGYVCGGGYPPPPIDFVADHPFMFMIREDYSGTILFVGTILDPTSC